MRKLLTEFIDVLFPPSPEEKLLRSANHSEIRSLIKTGTFKQIEYLFEYSEPIIRTAIIENKFNHNRLAAKLLGTALETYSSNQAKTTIYVPIPLGRSRQRQRGHNQVETILQSTRATLRINTGLLKRTVETAPQSHLDKKDRQKNMHDAFSFVGKMSDLTPLTQIILVDDVVTTGATLLVARATLAPHLPPGVTLTCLALAH